MPKLKELVTFMLKVYGFLLLGACMVMSQGSGGQDPGAMVTAILIFFSLTGGIAFLLFAIDEGLFERIRSATSNSAKRKRKSKLNQ